VTSKSPAGIEVRELGGGRGNYEFDWRVEAVRRDQQDYKVIRSWSESRPTGPFTEEQTWQFRLDDIERRKNRLKAIEAALNSQDNGTTAVP
jgi:arylamine N-acetyltransferase